MGAPQDAPALGHIPGGLLRSCAGSDIPVLHNRAGLAAERRAASLIIPPWPLCQSASNSRCCFLVWPPLPRSFCAPGCIRGKRRSLFAEGVTNDTFALVLRQREDAFDIRRARKLLQESGADRIREREAQP